MAVGEALQTYCVNLDVESTMSSYDDIENLSAVKALRAVCRQTLTLLAPSTRKIFKRFRLQMVRDLNADNDKLRAVVASQACKIALAASRIARLGNNLVAASIQFDLISHELLEQPLLNNQTGLRVNPPTPEGAAPATPELPDWDASMHDWDWLPLLVEDISFM